jgi:hypothetical protein
MQRNYSKAFGIFLLVAQVLYPACGYSDPSTGNTRLARNCPMFSPQPVLPSTSDVKAGQHFPGEFVYLIRATTDFLRTWPAYEQCMRGTTDGSVALGENLLLYGQTKKNYARFLADLHDVCMRDAANNGDYCALPALQAPPHSER